jgi:hypothetical protein
VEARDWRECAVQLDRAERRVGVEHAAVDRELDVERRDEAPLFERIPRGDGDGARRIVLVRRAAECADAPCAPHEQHDADLCTHAHTNGRESARSAGMRGRRLSPRRWHVPTARKGDKIPLRVRAAQGRIRTKRRVSRSRFLFTCALSTPGVCVVNLALTCETLSSNTS